MVHPEHLLLSCSFQLCCNITFLQSHSLRNLKCYTEHSITKLATCSLSFHLSSKTLSSSLVLRTFPLLILSHFSLHLSLTQQAPAKLNGQQSLPGVGSLHVFLQLLHHCPPLFCFSQPCTTGFKVSPETQYTVHMRLHPLHSNSSGQVQQLLE